MNRRWMLAAVAAVGLAFSTLPFMPGCSKGEVGAAQSSASSPCDPKAQPANMDFVLKDMDGNDVRLADYKGKVVILNFWATWCGPCKTEIPAFVKLQERYRDRGVVFLGLSVDDPVEKLRPFAEQYKMNYPVLVGLGRDDVQDAFGPVWGIPVTFMISRDGKICKRHMGLATVEQFEKEIESLL
jgi:cytochrome c biogenesis protein CcmG/thiol:disulfide interchange protein DsbE